MQSEEGLVHMETINMPESHTAARTALAAVMAQYPDAEVLMEWRTMSYKTPLIKQIVRLADNRYIMRVRIDTPIYEGIWSTVEQNSNCTRIMDRL